MTVTRIVVYLLHKTDAQKLTSAGWKSLPDNPLAVSKEIGSGESVTAIFVKRASVSVTSYEKEG